MSVHVSAPVWKLRLPPSLKLVLLYLADCANEDGRNARPSQNRIARQTGLSLATVCRSLKALLQARLVEIEIPADVRKRWANVYRVNMELILQKCHPTGSDSPQPEGRLSSPRSVGSYRGDGSPPSPRGEGSSHSDMPSVLNPVVDSALSSVHDSVPKKQTLSASRKNRADAPDGNPSAPRWQKLRGEITKAARDKSMEVPKSTEAWKALGLQGPVGQEYFRKTWESRFTEWANQGWTTGRIASEFWDKCRTYQIPMPEEFQSALVSAIRAEGIPFDFHMAEGRATESTSESNNSSLPTSASKTNHAVASSDFEEE